MSAGSCTCVGDVDEPCGVVHPSWLMQVRVVHAHRRTWVGSDRWGTWGHASSVETGGAHGVMQAGGDVQGRA
jgi:hypothetical protein